jgi:heme A synthase
MKLNAFAGYAWASLVWNVLVVLWGAYVRAVGAGAGCGEHWPTCNGQVIPLQGGAKTFIEFSHRASSGVALIMIAVLLIWAWRAYGRGHSVRLGAALSSAFILSEALLGAGLVLFGLVANDVSVQRGAATSLHLVNTFALLAALALTAWWASGGRPFRLKGRAALPVTLGAAAVLILGMSGAIAALGDTLFPSTSLAEGLAQDFSAGAHIFLQLRAVHPILAMATGLYLVIVASAYGITAGGAARRLGSALIILVVLQWAAGALNVVLLAPVWLQMVHLLLADSVWIVFVLMAAAALAVPAAAETQDLAGRPLARSPCR